MVWRKKSSEHDLTALMPAIWRYALSLSGHPELANDLSQATALRAIERADQFKSGSYEAWCITICRSIWLNERRAQAIRDRHAISVADEDALGSVFPTSETNIYASEVFTKVMHLPEAQRETAVLVFVTGFTYREVAEILDVPIGTVMSRLSVARRKIMDWAEEPKVESQ